MYYFEDCRKYDGRQALGPFECGWCWANHLQVVRFVCSSTSSKTFPTSSLWVLAIWELNKVWGHSKNSLWHVVRPLVRGKGGVGRGFDDYNQAEEIIESIRLKISFSQTMFFFSVYHKPCLQGGFARSIQRWTGQLSPFSTLMTWTNMKAWPASSLPTIRR